MAATVGLEIKGRGRDLMLSGHYHLADGGRALVDLARQAGRG